MPKLHELFAGRDWKFGFIFTAVVIGIIVIVANLPATSDNQGDAEHLKAESIRCGELIANRATIIDEDGFARLMLESEGPDQATGSTITMFDQAGNVKLRISEGSDGQRIAISDSEGRPRIAIDVFDTGEITFFSTIAGKGWSLKEEDGPEVP